VGYFRAAAEVGIYQAVSTSSILFSTILGGFVTIFSPMIVDLYQENRTDELNELFKVSTKWVFYLSIPPFLVMCLTPQDFISVVFGPKYVDGYLPLIILVVGQLINAGAGAVHIIMVMTGQQKRWLLTTGTVLVLNVVLNWVLIPKLGLTGAALASAVSVVGLSIVGLLQVRRHVGLWPYDIRYVKGLLSAVLAVGALLLLHLADIDSSLINLAASCAISFGLFSLALILLGLDTEDRDLVQLVRTRFSRG
jgi:O-antigen/teichoic acid export membrane protein